MSSVQLVYCESRNWQSAFENCDRADTTVQDGGHHGSVHRCHQSAHRQEDGLSVAAGDPVLAVEGRRGAGLRRPGGRQQLSRLDGDDHRAS